ncbi:hypothetical protein DMJ13_17340 [halophilic archaeon]|nr:hypothetical protein DMJ13_17340 [halophilic archaeon]
MTHSEQTKRVLALARGDSITVDTQHRTLTGIVYRCNHHDPELTCRGPEPGEHVLYFVTPTYDRYCLQYTYYDEYDHTQQRLDRYGRTPDGQYVWLRTHAHVESITNPTEDGEQL